MTASVLKHNDERVQ